MIPGTPTGWYSKLNPLQQFLSGLAVRTGVGSLVGGATAEMQGGKFLQGMGQGAWTSAFGFIFNEAGEMLQNMFHPFAIFPPAYLDAEMALDPGGYIAPDTASIGYLGLGIGGTLSLLVAPAVLFPIATTAFLSYAPQINQYGLDAVDFANGYLPGTPPPTVFGWAGWLYGNFGH